jgi:hypothetical protein
MNTYTSVSVEMYCDASSFITDDIWRRYVTHSYDADHVYMD